MNHQGIIFTEGETAVIENGVKSDFVTISKVLKRQIITKTSSGEEIRFSYGNKDYWKNFKMINNGSYYKEYGILVPLTENSIAIVEKAKRDLKSRKIAEDNEKARRESDEAEYRAWCETDEGRAAEAMQDYYEGTYITVQHLETTSGRHAEVLLLGKLCNEVERFIEVSLRQDTDWSSGLLKTTEIGSLWFSTTNAGKISKISALLSKAAEVATAWDADCGLKWNSDTNIPYAA